MLELRRLARREGLADAAERALSSISLFDVDRAVLDGASAIDPIEVRSLDAIHLHASVALAGRGSVVAVLTYDHQLQVACAHHGLAVEAPFVS